MEQVLLSLLGHPSSPSFFSGVRVARYGHTTYNRQHKANVTATVPDHLMIVGRRPACSKRAVRLNL